MKKKLVIAIISTVIVLSLGLICYFCLFDTAGLVYKEENEQITYFCTYWLTHAAVTDTGNCYINGTTLIDEQNYGVENIRKYNNRFNIIAPIRSVRIYDKGDAVSININEYGGTIITKSNDLYIFINGNDSYRTPTFFCSGYISAILGDEGRIYVLSENGDFGYVTVDKPDDFSLIGQNVTAFKVVSKNSPDSIFALTNDHRLYILEPDETIQNSEKYIDNIVNFDVLVPHMNLCVLSIVDEKQDAYVSMRNSGVTYDCFSDKRSFKKVGENICSVTSYGSGVAMMYENGDVALYGSDLDEVPDNWEFTGDIVFSDVKAVFGGFDNLIVIKTNGEMHYYGTLPDEATIGITPKSIHS